MQNELTDIELWMLVQDSNKEALAQLFDRYYFHLVKNGIYFCQDPELAKDTAHDVFVKLWLNRANLSVVSNVKAYLNTTYRNELYSVLKSKSRHQEEMEKWIGTEEAHELSYEDLIISLQLKEEQKLKVQAAFKKLTPRQKEYLQLKFFEGLSYAQIAESTGQVVKTVYNTTYEAIKILRQEISL